MTSIASLDGRTAAQAQGGSPSQRPAASSGELAKLEVQLSDWVHCPSSKTSAGKAMIAEITDKIDAIKTSIKAADEAKAASAKKIEANRLQPATEQSLRLDGQGGWLNLRA